MKHVHHSIAELILVDDEKKPPATEATRTKTKKCQKLLPEESIKQLPNAVKKCRKRKNKKAVRVPAIPPQEARIIRKKKQGEPTPRLKVGKKAREIISVDLD
jgi:hypothetical protein